MSVTGGNQFHLACLLIKYLQARMWYAIGLSAYAWKSGTVSAEEVRNRRCGVDICLWKRITAWTALNAYTSINHKALSTWRSFRAKHREKECTAQCQTNRHEATEVWKVKTEKLPDRLSPNVDDYCILSTLPLARHFRYNPFRWLVFAIVVFMLIKKLYVFG